MAWLEQQMSWSMYYTSLSSLQWSNAFRQTGVMSTLKLHVMSIQRLFQQASSMAICERFHICLLSQGQFLLRSRVIWWLYAVRKNNRTFSLFFSVGRHRKNIRRSIWEGKQFTISIWYDLISPLYPLSLIALRILTRDPNILGEFISSVQTTYLATQERMIAIHNVDSCVFCYSFLQK